MFNKIGRMVRGGIGSGKARASLIVACAAVSISLLAPAAQAVTCYVDATMPPGGVWPARGGAWGMALNDLQTALAAAAVPAFGITEVRVAQGTYKPTAGVGRGVSFQMVDNVAVIGGFPTGGGPVAVPATYVTILSGEIAGAGLGDNSYHVVQANGTGLNGLLSGFKIINGYANGVAAPNNTGGGMLITNSNIKVVNCVFYNNYAAVSGAAMQIGSTVLVENCSFDNNYSFGSGGAVALSGLNVTPELRFCQFTNNKAVTSGGAVFGNLLYAAAPGPAFQILSSFFWNNTSALGGAVYNSGAGARLRVINSVFSNNGASGNGGAIYFNAGCGMSELVNCTLGYNVAGGNGGGFYGGAAGNKIYNSILWWNTDMTCPAGGYTPMAQLNLAGAALNVQFNDIQLTPPGTTNFSLDPLFIAGSKLDVPVGSLVRNAGNNALLPPDYGDFDGDGIFGAEPIATDFVHNQRIIGNVDVGAYEH